MKQRGSHGEVGDTVSERKVRFGMRDRRLKRDGTEEVKVTLSISSP